MERYRTTIIMVVALLVLGGAALFLSNKNASTPGTATPVPIIYMWEEANPVKAIDVVSGTNKVSLVKDATLGTWAITAPEQRPADLFTVTNVADSLQRLQAQFSVTTTTDLTQYGLGTDGLSVTATFSDTQGTKRVFDIGSATPDGSGYYVKEKSGSKVYVVSNVTIEPLRGWLTTPPVQQPTATPIPITVVPTEPATATPAAGATTVTGQTPAASTPGVTVTTAPTSAATSVPATGATATAVP